MALSQLLTSPTGLAALCVVAGAVALSLQQWWRNRSLMLGVRRLGKPTPGWNLVLGTLLKAGELVSALPRGAHSAYILNSIARDHPDGVFYFDVWPMTAPMVIVTDPLVAEQVALHPVAGARKPAHLQNWFHAITGGPSLFDTNGPAWRRLHALFSPGFSAANIAHEVPIIAEKAAIFRSLLRERAREGKIFHLEPLALNAVIDIIGEVLLNARLDAQRRPKPHPLADTMVRQLQLKFVEYAPQNMLLMLSPWLKVLVWRNGRVLDALIRAQLEARFRVFKETISTAATTQEEEKKEKERPRFKSVMDLAIEEYMSQHPSATAPDAEFLTITTRNMRMFFFAGYDSTASTIVYCYHNLFSNPAALARARAEHDAVFGPLSSTSTDDDGNDNDVAAQIARDPSLLNRLPYTLAAIKESMRLFPAASGVREGAPELELVDAKGNKYPTAGFSVLLSHYCIHRNPACWPRPHEFLPERWLLAESNGSGGPGPADELYTPPEVRRAAWRPFEHGPRLCVGQQLVLTEVKAVLACTLREFDIRECYAEVDGGKGKGKEKVDLAGVDGARPYMVEAGSSHPVDRYPCRVSFSGYVSHGEDRS